MKKKTKKNSNTENFETNRKNLLVNDVIKENLNNKEIIVKEEDESNKTITTEDGWITNSSFEELNLNKRLMKGITKSGFSKMTEIQAKSIPTLLTGKDLLAQAKTGSVKYLLT
jgi:ATP-dependent RNA helicase DDX18/HAS1